MRYFLIACAVSLLVGCGDYIASDDEFYGSDDDGCSRWVWDDDDGFHQCRGIQAAPTATPIDK